MLREDWLDKSVYVVDDDVLVLDLLCSKLGLAGYRAQGFSDPSAFLAAAPGLSPGCVILDLDMPGVDGLQVQESLSGMGLDLPIIFYSGRGSVKHAVHGMRAGAADFLQKGSSMEPLLRALKGAFGKLELS